MQEIKTRYELLIRYDANGQPAGASVRYLYTTLRDGRPPLVEEGSPEPIDLAEFGASELISETTRDALAEVDRLNSAFASQGAALTTATDEIARQQADLQQSAELVASQAAALAAANQQIAALQLVGRELQEALAEANAIIAGRDAALDQAAHDVDALTEGKRDALAQAAILAGQVDARNADLAAARSQIAELRAANDALQAQYAEAIATPAVSMAE